MHARLSRFAGLAPARIESTVQSFLEQQLPTIEQHQGFLGVAVMVNRGTGQAAAITYWEREADMRDSERAAGEAVQAALARAEPSREPIIDRYEVVFSR